MDNTLRDRLRRLGVKQGREGIVPLKPRAARAREGWAGIRANKFVLNVL